jgi:phage terminase small subunit
MANKKKLEREDTLDIMSDILDGLDLTPKEADFVLRYFQTYNATQAAMQVYKYDKYKAAVMGNRLLHRPHVRSAIKKMKKIQRKIFDIDPNEYLEFLLKSARADISDYLKFSEEEVPVLDKDGSVMRDPDTGEPITKLVNKMHLVNSEEVDASLIVSVKQGRDGISINLPDKMQAWEKLRQYFGWGEKQNENVDNSDSIIKAIQGKTEEVWDDEDEYEELDKALKDNGQ